MALSRKIFIARTGDIREGGSKVFSYGVHPAIAVCRNGRVLAYINRCTHMGGPVECVGDVLRCRWHQAEFDPNTGDVVCGQAPSGTKLASLDVQQDEQGYFVEFVLPPDPFS